MILSNYTVFLKTLKRCDKVVLNFFETDIPFIYRTIETEIENSCNNGLNKETLSVLVVPNNGVRFYCEE